jgi:hypothetical protein
MVVALPLEAPNLPPLSPWEAYVWYLLWVPFLLRMGLLTGPVRKVVDHYAPHSSWFYTRLKQLRLPGIRWLIFTEVLAFSLPPFAALTLRLFMPPVGWDAWSAGPVLGLWLFVTFFLIWMWMDWLRVMNTRRLFLALCEQDLAKIRRRLGPVIRVRDAARIASSLSLRKWFRGESEQDAQDASKKIKNRILRAGTKVVSTGLGLAGKALEKGRVQAEKVADGIDARIAEEFNEQRHSITLRTMKLLIIRDVPMSLAPIFVILGLGYL